MLSLNIQNRYFKCLLHLFLFITFFYYHFITIIYFNYLNFLFKITITKRSFLIFLLLSDF